MPVLTPPEIARLRSRFLDRYDGNTLAAYKQDLDAYARWAKEESTDVALCDLFKLKAPAAEEKVEAYKKKMAGTKIHTLRRRLSTLRNFSSYLHSKGVVAWTLVVSSRVKRSEKQKEKAAPKNMSGPPEEAVLGLLKTLAACDTLEATRDHAIISLHYYSCLRPTELLRLNIKDISFRSSRIIIRGKGRETTEEVDITSGTAASIKNWLSRRPGPNSGPVFIRLDRAAEKMAQKTGFWPQEALTRTGLFLKLRAYGKQIGFPLRPHGLRHTAITSALQKATKARIPYTDVQEFARHKNFSTTAGYVNKSGLGAKRIMDLLPEN